MTDHDRADSRTHPAERAEAPEHGPEAPHHGTPDAPGDAPPPLGSWPRLYGLVIAELVAFVLLLAWLTRRFS